MAGAPWVDFEWLYQLFLYRLHEAGGFFAIVWANAALGALAVWLTWRAALLQGGGPGPAALCAACALSLVRTRSFSRPETLSLVLLPLFLHAILRFRKEGKARALAWLPAWMVLWVNCHAGFALGLAVPGLAALGAWLESLGLRRARSSPQERARLVRAAKVLGLCFAACVIATLLNPYGARVHQVVLSHLRETGVLGRLGAIEEWRGLRLGEYPVYWLLLAAAFGLLARDVLRARPQALFWAPLLLVFGAWSSRQVRNPVYFALIAGPYVFGRAFAGRGAAAAAWLRRAAAMAAFALFIACLWPVRQRDFQRPVRWEFYPKGAADFLEENGVQGPMFNDCAFGGYLEWRLGRGRPVFCDSRYLFHPMMTELALLAARPEAFRAYVERSGTDYAVVRHGQGPVSRVGGRELARSPWPSLFPRKLWALVYWDDAGLVFMRRNRGQDGLIRRCEYRSVDPDDADFLLEQARASRARREQLLAELRRPEREGEPCALRAWLRSRLENP